MLGHEVDSVSCRMERKGGDLTACQHIPLWVTQNTGGGGLGNAWHEDILLRAKQTSLSTLPPPIQKKDNMKLQLWKFIQTALNFNSQPSPTQSPLIATRPVNVRCLEWKQRVKIPVWIFSWKSVIENHLSVRQNQLLHVKLKKKQHKFKYYIILQKCS